MLVAGRILKDKLTYKNKHTMNSISNFRLCTLTDVELLQEIDRQTDKMFTEQKVPVRHIPAEPNKDYDLLIGELLIRNTEKIKALQELLDLKQLKFNDGEYQSDEYRNRKPIAWEVAKNVLEYPKT